MENIVGEYRRLHRLAGFAFINGEINYDEYLQKTEIYARDASKALPNNYLRTIKKDENLLDRAERMMNWGSIIPGDYFFWEPYGFTKILSIDHNTERPFVNAKNCSQSLDHLIFLTQEERVLIGQSHHLHSLPRHLWGYLNAQKLD